VVDDDFLLGMRLVPDPIDPGDDPYAALAAAFIEDSLPAAFKYDREGTRGQQLLDRLREVRAEGVILMAPSFCDPALLDQPMLTRALDAAGVPYTTFKYSEDSGQFQVIREQAGTFADAIKLWGTR
jgi:benzoyl-CoA reductase subunit C